MLLEPEILLNYGKIMSKLKGKKHLIKREKASNDIRKDAIKKGKSGKLIVKSKKSKSKKTIKKIAKTLPTKSEKKKPATVKSEEANDNNEKKISLKDPSLTRKERKVLVKKKKDKTGMIEILMQHYEKLRRKNVKKEVKKDLIDDVFKVTEGQEKEVIFKHSSTRVFEMCMKYGNNDQRAKVFDMFNQFPTELIQSRYAKFLVKKLMKYGNKEQRAAVVKSFHGKVGRLIRQKEASGILEFVYNEYANASQRASLIEEFYGPEYAVFKASIGRSLDEIFTAESDKKPLLLNHMKNNLVPLVQKDVVSHTLIHHALYQYFRHAEGHLRSEMIEALVESVVQILHTRDGSRVAMYCLWHGTAKERKQIMKTFKTFIPKICKEEYGHQVLLALFDCVDDTVLVKKIVFPELLNNFDELVHDQYGRKVLLYLFAGRKRDFFLPETITMLTLGDGNAASKKSADVRSRELQNGILSQFCEFAADAFQCKQLLRDKSASQILIAAATCCEESDQLQGVYEAIAKQAAKSFDSSDEDHVIGHACAHWVIRKLVLLDKEREDEDSSTSLSRALINSVPAGSFSDWVQVNRGCFVLVSLLESGVDEVVKRITDDLTFAKEQLKTCSTPGGKLLKKLLGYK